MTINFWNDRWCGWDQPLRVEFPALFRIVSNPTTMVYSVMEVSNGMIFWNITFGRDLQDQELEEFNVPLASLYEVKACIAKVDRSRWTLTNDGIFSVCTYFKSLMGPIEGDFPLKAHLEEQSASQNGISFVDGHKGESSNY